MEKAKRQGVAGNIDATLSPGEKLLIWRKRMGYSQMEAASYFDVFYFVYKMAEYGVAKDFPYKKIKITLRPHEKCLILRKRMGKTQREIAEDFGICREWMIQQERGEVDCTKLLEWLEQK